jgi:lysophospholipase L1-like esterase
MHKSWVSRIAAWIENMQPSLAREVLVVNASVNGSTTRQALERMPYEVQSHGVDVLVVQFGMNDCNYWLTDRGLPRVSPAGFAANLAEIIDRAVHSGARRVFLNTNHPTTRTADRFPNTSKTYEESNREYNAIIRRVAAENGADLVQLNDVERAFNAHLDGGTCRLGELLLEDGLHLTARGHEIYFDLIALALETALRRVAANRELPG